MRTLEEADKSAYEKQFSRFLKAGLTADDMEDMYKEAHQKIRADPVRPKKEKKEYNTVIKGRRQRMYVCLLESIILISQGYMQQVVRLQYCSGFFTQGWRHGQNHSYYHTISQKNVLDWQHCHWCAFNNACYSHQQRTFSYVLLDR